jgi:uncharacterized membrane protein
MSEKNENANASTTPYSIVAFRFDGQNAAREKLRQIKLTGALDEYGIEAQAVVDRDENNQIHVHEPGHGVFGAASGAAVGSLLGMLGGPVGLLALGIIGGAVGGAAGRGLGRAIPMENLETLGEYLVPDSSAFLLLLEEIETEKLIDGLESYSGTVVKLTVDEALSAKIAEHNIARRAGD